MSENKYAREGVNTAIFFGIIAFLTGIVLPIIAFKQGKKFLEKYGNKIFFLPIITFVLYYFFYDAFMQNFGNTYSWRSDFYVFRRELRLIGGRFFSDLWPIYMFLIHSFVFCYVMPLTISLILNTVFKDHNKMVNGQLVSR